MTGVEISAVVIGGAYVSWWAREVVFGGMKQDIADMKMFQSKIKTVPFEKFMSKKKLVEAEIEHAENLKDLVAIKKRLYTKFSDDLKPAEWKELICKVSEKMGYLKRITEHADDLF